MFIFSIAEMLNKLFGLLIVSIIARELGVNEFASYALAMVIFGYFVEISYYSLQNKHLFSYGENPENYLESQIFATRFVIMMIFSFTSFLVFNVAGYIYLSTNIFPISLILLISILNLDFLMYIRNKSSYLILARFFSQIVLFLALYFSVKFYTINSSNIMFYQMLNSLILIFVVLILSKRFSYASLGIFWRAFKNGFGKLQLIKIEIKTQFSNFSLKIIALSIVTIEMPIILLTGQKVIDDLAISHRLALIFLPFIIFYLNLNSKNISEKDLLYKTFFSTLISCFLILFSMFTLRIVFGQDYVPNAQLYALFFSVIPFQTILNYLFYLASKENLERNIIVKLGVIFFIYTFLVLLISFFIDLNPVLLSSIIFVKYIIIVFSFSIISLSNRFYTIIFISFVQAFSYCLYFSGGFKYGNYILIDLCNSLYEKLGCYFE